MLNVRNMNDLPIMDSLEKRKNKKVGKKNVKNIN